MVDKKGAFATGVTVRRSWPAQLADGTTALILDTHEVGPIAFVVTLEIIEILRAELAKLEVALRTPTSRA